MFCCLPKETVSVQFGHGKNNFFAFSPVYYSVMILVLKAAEGLPVTLCSNVYVAYEGKTEGLRQLFFLSEMGHLGQERL